MRSHAFKICPLRTLEMAFQSTKISKFSGGAWPQTPLVPGPLSTHLIRRRLKKNNDFSFRQSFCVSMIPSVLNSSKRKNN